MTTRAQSLPATRTRGSLLRAGRRVLESKGLHKTRISDITREAGVSVGTFYVHFPDKAEFLRQLLIIVEDEVYGELVPTKTGSVDATQRIHETNRLFLAAFKRNAAFWKAIEVAELADPEFPDILAERQLYYRGRTERAIKHWQQTGDVAPDVDPVNAAFALGAMSDRLSYVWFVFHQRTDIERATAELTQLWLNYLGIDTESPPI